MLRAYANEELTLSAIHARLLPVLSADPLDVSQSDATRWDESPGDERLFWRLVYLLDTETTDGPELRALAARIVRSLARTGSVHDTHELLPILLDQPRLCLVIKKYNSGVISRTGILSFIAESGYPEHVKLWMRHASGATLGRLCAQLAAGEFDAVMAGWGTLPE